jgi:hypothetical protein
MKKPVVIILLVFALLFVLAGIAATIFFTINVGFSTNNPFDGRNIASRLEDSKTLNVNTEKPLTLKVTDDSGDVTITGADVETVQVRAVKTAYDSSQSRADQEVKSIKYTIEQNGNTITLKYELPKSMNFNNKVNTVDFIVTVPNETTVDVTTFGEVSVEGTNGNVDIITSFGDVTVQNIEGRVTVETQSGKVDASSVNADSANIELSSGFGRISLEKASGKDIRLKSQSGVLETINVRASGNIELSTDFGDIVFRGGSANALDAATNSGKLTLKTLTLRGTLTAKSDFGEISVEQVKAAAYDAQTNSGSIMIDGAFGKVKAHSGFGSVTVRNADSVSLDLDTQSGPVDFEGSLGDGPHTVQSDFGEITLIIPADSALNVDLKTDFGSIKSEIPITVVLSGEVEKNHQTGTMNDGGDQLSVETQSGSISIETSR